MIIFGPVVMLKGRQLFPWVVSGVVSFVTLLAGVMLFSILGWMDATMGFWICIGVAVALAVITGFITFRLVWVAIGLLGIIAGLFLGILLFTMTVAAFGVGGTWMMAGFAIVFACLGGYCAWKFAKEVVLIGTSLIGSYAFMRGCSYFIGGYPNEAELVADFENQLPVEDMYNIFWIYVAMFVLGTIIGVVYQVKNGKDHESLDNDQHYAKSSDNFQRYRPKVH